MVWPPMLGRAPVMRAVKEGYMAASSPTMRMSGEIALAAVPMPEISPPPPMGMGRTWRSGASSSISSAAVPWPAMTSRSLKAWTNTRSRRSQISRA